MLGRKAVVQRQHRTAAAQRELAAQAVVRFQIADHEAAAVQVEQHRQALVRRRVKACRQIALRAVLPRRAG
jgi:hypothetical protein